MNPLKWAIARSGRSTLFSLGFLFFSIGAHIILIKLPMPPLGQALSDKTLDENSKDSALEPSVPLSVAALSDLIEPSPPAPPIAPEPPADPNPPAPTELTAPVPIVPEPSQPITPPEPLATEPEEPELTIEPTPTSPVTPPTQPPTPNTLQLEAETVVHFSETFPHLAGTQLGCFGLSNCGRVEGMVRSHRDASRQLIPELESQGYQVTVHNEDDGPLVYKLLDPQQPEAEVQYLNIFPDGLGAAVYVITLEPISLEELKQLDSQS